MHRPLFVPHNTRRSSQQESEHKQAALYLQDADRHLGADQRAKNLLPHGEGGVDLDEPALCLE